MLFSAFSTIYFVEKIDLIQCKMTGILSAFLLHEFFFFAFPVA